MGVVVVDGDVFFDGAVKKKFRGDGSMSGDIPVVQDPDNMRGGANDSEMK